MSANTTAGRPAIDSSNRAISAARSQPALETASSPCSSPAIDWTAATNALATSAWARTMPTSRSLIVFFEVLPQHFAVAGRLGRLGPLLHARDQPLVESARRI